MPFQLSLGLLSSGTLTVLAQQELPVIHWTHAHTWLPLSRVHVLSTYNTSFHLEDADHKPPTLQSSLILPLSPLIFCSIS